MRTRGRPSSVSKTLVSGNFGERPEPPNSLTKRQKAIWREVVAAEDPILFNTAVLRGLLADYCRRRATGEEISEVIDGSGAVAQQDDEQLARFDQLLRMRDREMTAVITAATKLRLTNQSRYQPVVAGRAADRGAVQDTPWRKSA